MTRGKKSTFWNDAREAELRRRIDAGESGGVIAQALGCTRNTVIGKVVRLKLRFTSERQPPKRFKVGRTVPAVSLPRRRNKRPPKRVAYPAPDLPAPIPCGPIGDIPDSRRACRWTDDDVQDPNWRMCGTESWYGSSYCPHHHARAYRPTPTLKVAGGEAFERSAAQ